MKENKQKEYIKIYDIEKNKSLFKSESLTRQLDIGSKSEIMIRVNNEDKEKSDIIIDKIDNGFRHILNLALRFKAVKEALNDNKLKIVLHDTKDYDQLCIAKFSRDTNEINLKADFDKLSSSATSPQYITTLFSMLDTFIFETCNYLNKEAALVYLLTPLMLDIDLFNNKDLFALIMEYGEHNSCHIANKIYKESGNIPSYLYRTEDFSTYWETTNSLEFNGKNATTSHTETYRKRFDKCDNKHFKVSYFDIQHDQASLKELKEFSSKLHKEVTEMYNNKAKFLPEQKIFDKFISTLNQIVDNEGIIYNNHGEVKKTISEEFSQVDNSVEISGDLAFSQTSTDISDMSSTLS